LPTFSGVTNQVLQDKLHLSLEHTMIKNKNNFHLYTNLCSKRVHRVLFDCYKITGVNAAQNFFSLIASGLNKNTEKAVFVNSILPINSKEHKRVFWVFPSEKENEIEYKYIPLINLPFIRNVLLSTYIFFEIIFKRNISQSTDIVVLDYLRFSVNLGATLACKIRRIKTLVIATDLPGEDVFEKTIQSKIRNSFIFLLNYDFFVCVTEDLNSVVNTKKRPSVIIESFANENFTQISNLIQDKYDEKVIVYAGGIYERYGIKNLIEGFKRIKDENVRLWFFGVGSFVEAIQEFSRLDSRIVYKGVVPNEDLIDIFCRATLLINPRPSNEIFTKYSFPSKNMEFMATGTPLVTTRLPGIPEDHWPYIYFIDDETELGIFNSLNTLLQKSKGELHSFGAQCKDFTLANKNNIIQAKKMIQLINQNNC
jgi:glycosyltransferase involved in cell wall biosynthesis